LFTEADSEYFVVLVKKRPSHVYKFSSHQPETSTNRTSRPDLAALPPLSKPVALIPEETVTQVSFENAITVRNPPPLRPFFTNSWFRLSTAVCGVTWSINGASLLDLALRVPIVSKSGSVSATTT
jgi:hypothetical protein